MMTINQRLNFKNDIKLKLNTMLHSLVIKNFRCLEDFTVEKLERINLYAE